MEMAESTDDKVPIELDTPSNDETNSEAESDVRTEVEARSNKDENVVAENDDESASQAGSNASQESPAAPPRRPNVLIICLHGFSEEYPVVHTNGKIEDAAHIMTFSFKPDRIFGERGSIDNLDDIARELLDFILSTSRDINVDLHDLSIGFMAADLGGVLLKKALLHAMADTAYKLIYAKTILLIFFATPHQASLEYSWETTISKIMEDTYRCIRGPWTIDRVNQLAYHLERVRLDFERILGKFRIINYFQDLPDSSSEIVTVQKSCAELRGFGITNIGANLTHYELHGFVNESQGEELIIRGILDIESYADDNYCQLIQRLSLEADGIEPVFYVPGYSHLASRIIHSEKLEAIFCGDEARLVLLGIEADVDARQFLSSLRDAIHEEIPQYPGVCIACSVMTVNEPSSLTETGLLSDFLLQVLKLYPSLTNGWVKFFSPRIIHSLRMSNVELRTRVLWECLRQVLTCASHYRGFWLIHTTNTPDQHRLLIQIINKLQYFSELAEVSWKVIAIGDSRSIADFSSPRSLLELTLSQDALKDSIEKDIELQLDLIIRETPSISKMKEKVLQILHKQQSNPRLVGFFLQTLQFIPPPLPNVLTDLANNFTSIETALKATFERVPKEYRAWIRDILMFICFSFRPMTTTELEIAVATFNSDSLQKLEDTIGYGTVTHITSLLPGVLRIQGGKIYVVHDELRLFLTQSPDDAWYHQEDCHLKIALACYNYLSVILTKFGDASTKPLAEDIAGMRLARSLPGYFEEVPKYAVLGFSQYAALYWCDHYLRGMNNEAASPQNTPWLTEPGPLGEMLSLRHYSNGRLENDYCTPKEILPSHLREVVGMTELDAFKLVVQMVDRQQSRAFVDLIHPLTSHSENTSVSDWILSNYPRFPVSEIVLNDSYILDRLFQLDKESLLSDVSDILVSITFRNDHALLLDFLSKLEGEPSDKKLNLTEASAKACYYAVKLGLVDIAKILSSYQASPFYNLQTDISDSVPLFHIAIATGSKQMIQLFIDAGVDVNMLTPSGEIVPCDSTPLHIACQYAQVGIVRLLLDAGADTKVVGEQGVTALHVASWRGFASVCKLLVDYGATLTVDKDAQSPLHIPAKYSQEPRYIATANVLIEALKKQFPNFEEAGSQDAQDLAAIINVQCDYKKKTALIYTAVTGNLDLAKVLIKLGADVHLREEEGFNAMCRAAMMNEVEMIRLLADNGCEIDDPRSDGRHALHDACAWGSQQAIEELLKRNAAPDHADEDKTTPITVGATWGLMRVIKQLIPASSKDSMSLALVFAARYGYHEIVTTLLDAGADINYQDSFGNTPLQFSCWNSQSRVTQILLPRMPDINRPDNDNFTATNDAARRGAYECLKLVLDAGAYTEIEDSSGYRPLIRAAEVSDDCFRLLLERGAQTVLPAAIEKPDATPFSAGLSFLAGLAYKFEAGAVKVYLEYKSPRISEIAFFSEINEALAAAAFASKLENLQVLLEYGADPNVIITKFNEKHSSAIGLAIAYDNIYAVQILLDNKVTPVDLNKVDDYRDTPLHIALSLCTSSMEQRMVELLLKYGADPRISSGKFGTVLSAASQAANDDIFSLIFSQPGVSPDAADQLGRLPIHVAASYGVEKQLIKRLLTETSTFKSQDKQGRNVLHHAAVGGTQFWAEHFLIKMILDECPDLINVPDQDGWTPLHWACRNSVDGAMKYLIERGADKEAKTHDRWTPRHMVIYHGFPDRLELLPEGDNETEDDELPNEAAQKVTDDMCDSCYCLIYGTGYRCGSCPKYWFCFKCYWHAEDTHPKGHVFQRFDQDSSDIATPTGSEHDTDE